ncbi:MAG: hypothetical protein AAGI70_09425, partial [Pseudomonadota bacterium]
MNDAYDFWAARLPAPADRLIATFWETFTRLAPRLDAAFTSQDNGRVMAETELFAAAIDTVSDEIMFEFGPGAEGGHHLALTPELTHDLRPLCRALVRGAPDLARWSFSDARPALTGQSEIETALTGRLQDTPSITGAEARPGEAQGIDIIGRGRGAAEEIGREAATAFSVLVGEEIERDFFNRSEGVSEGARMGRLFGKKGSNLDWLPAFREQALDIHQGLLDARPAGAFAAAPTAKTEMALLQLGASEVDDESYPRADLITYATAQATYAEARARGLVLPGVRFSRHGEMLCGIRIARSEARAFDEVTERNQLAEKIDGELRRRAIGGVFGEGHGAGHIYIDVSTLDIEAARTCIAEILGQA